MIDLKTHNDLTEKLINENERLEKELTECKIKLRKLEQSNDIQTMKDKQTLKKAQDSTLKTTKQQKQLKDRIDQLSHQVTTKDIEITELKQRLALKTNISDKQRDKMLQDFRKWQGRKPSNSSDYKMMSVISHYETQLQKYQIHIQKFKVQFENSQELIRSLKKQLIDRDKENCDMNINKINKDVINFKNSLDSISVERKFKKYETDIAQLKKALKKSEEEKLEIRSRYEQLVKDYYKTMNSTVGKPTKHTQITQTKDESLHFSISKLSDDEPIQFNPDGFIITELVKILGVDQHNLVTAVRKMDAALKTLPKMQQCLNAAKTAIEQIKNKKLTYVQIPEAIQELHQQKQALMSLLKTIENKLGTDMDNILPELNKIKKLSSEYLDCLRTTAFLRGVEHAKQIKEFMDFFNLQPGEQIGPQVIQLYEQIKAIRGFVEICNKIMQTQYGISECLMKVTDIVARQTSKQ